MFGWVTAIRLNDLNVNLLLLYKSPKRRIFCVLCVSDSINLYNTNPRV